MDRWDCNKVNRSLVRAMVSELTATSRKHDKDWRVMILTEMGNRRKRSLSLGI